MLKAVSYCMTTLVSRYGRLSASHATVPLPLSQTTSETMEISHAEQAAAVSELLAADTRRETMASHRKASSYCCSLLTMRREENAHEHDGRSVIDA